MSRSNFIPLLLRRVERLEQRLKLVEEEQRGGIDLSKFMPRNQRTGNDGDECEATEDGDADDFAIHPSSYVLSPLPTTSHVRSFPNTLPKRSRAPTARPRKYRRGRFIPVAKRHLIDLLAEHVAPDATAAEQFREVCRLLEEALHREGRERSIRLKDNYACLDPDVDVIAGKHLPAENCDAARTPSSPTCSTYWRRRTIARSPRDDVDAAVTALSPVGIESRSRTRRLRPARSLFARRQDRPSHARARGRR